MVWRLIAILPGLLLSACGGGSSSGGGNATAPPAPPVPTVAVEFVEVAGMEHTRIARLDLATLEGLASVRYVIATRPGGQAAPVQVSYSRDYLERQGYLDAAAAELDFPLFGLYADHVNAVEVTVSLADGSEVIESFSVPAAPFSRPEHDLGDVIVHRDTVAGGLNYLAVETTGTSVVVIDVDGETRWVAPDVGETTRSHLYRGGNWIVASGSDNSIYRIAWDGSFEESAISDPRYYNSHHNLDPGKHGILNNVGFRDGDVYRPESVLIEMGEDGTVLASWDFDEILAATILAAGEDPSTLVQNAVDWFHMNAAAYDPTDDGVLASARESFVIKVDHATGEIRWILGNPEKTWYTQFPNSLQPLALEVTGRPPIGQHSLSVSPDGSRLLLFNNGAGSFWLPDVGDTQEESLVQIFEIDEAAGTAIQTWRYDHLPSILSGTCSSAQWQEDGSVLVTYSQVNPTTFEGVKLGQHSRVVLVSPGLEVLYEASISKRRGDFAGCFTVYKVKRIGLEDMRFE